MTTAPESCDAAYSRLAAAEERHWTLPLIIPCVIGHRQMAPTPQMDLSDAS